MTIKRAIIFLVALQFISPAMANEVKASESKVTSSREIIEALSPSADLKTRGFKPRNLEVRKKISLAVEFEFNSAELTPAGIAAITELGIAFKSRSLIAQRFRIEGHTDSVGNPAYNMKLSLKRAESVCAYLKTHGIASSRMEPVGKGSSEPLDPRKPDAPQNRRVNIISF